MGSSGDHPLLLRSHVPFTMWQYVQTGLEADRVVATKLAELILVGILSSGEVAGPDDGKGAGTEGGGLPRTAGHLLAVFFRDRRPTDDLVMVIKVPAASPARLPHRVTGEKAHGGDDGVRADDGQPERPDRAQGRGVPLDDAKLVPLLAGQGRHPAIASHVLDGVLGNLQARATPAPHNPARDKGHQEDPEQDRDDQPSGIRLPTGYDSDHQRGRGRCPGARSDGRSHDGGALLHPGGPGARTRLVVRDPQIRRIQVSHLGTDASPPLLPLVVDIEDRGCIRDSGTGEPVSGNPEQRKGSGEP